MGIINMKEDKLSKMEIVHDCTNNSICADRNNNVGHYDNTNEKDKENLSGNQEY